MSLTSLPLELLLDILSLALHIHSNPVSLLLVNSEFFNICQPLLHLNLSFHTTAQLQLFSQGSMSLSCSPKSLSVTLSGGTADFRLFSLLRSALERCLRQRKEIEGQPSRLELKLMRLCLNSHTSDPNPQLIYHALHLANPEEFMWTGPDPDHHFSIAIVPSATPFLFAVISTWSNLRHLKITNIAFPSQAFSGRHSLSRSLLSGRLRALQTVYLGQVTFLDPFDITCVACGAGLDSLREVRVVDAYRESIWGPRIRGSDVEKAATSAYLASRRVDFELPHLEPDRMARISRLVRCEAKTERIMGGDRVESVGIL